MESLSSLVCAPHMGVHSLSCPAVLHGLVRQRHHLLRKDKTKAGAAEIAALGYNSTERLAEKPALELKAGGVSNKLWVKVVAGFPGHGAECSLQPLVKQLYRLRSLLLGEIRVTRIKPQAPSDSDSRTRETLQRSVPGKGSKTPSSV